MKGQQMLNRRSKGHSGDTVYEEKSLIPLVLRSRWERGREAEREMSQDGNTFKNVL